MRPRTQEDIDEYNKHKAFAFKSGDFGHLKNLLAYHLNEQKGSFCISGRPSDGVQIVSAEVKRGRVLVTMDDGRTFELKFELVEQFPKTPLGGVEVTREQALAGLGDPSTWDAHAKALYAEFRKKPESLPWGEEHDREN